MKTPVIRRYTNIVIVCLISIIFGGPCLAAELSESDITAINESNKIFPQHIQNIIFE